ncbi:MAG TPA: hypothetical protein VLZ89_01835 [Anaerolineales bacterium]|nr:hypothetical protein [Anaerolineales bacterium]
MDKFDTVVDTISLGADVGTIIASATGQLEVLPITEGVSDIAGGVGIVKGIYDLVTNHDAYGLSSALFWKQADNVLWRVEGEVPYAGTVGDAINFYRDIAPGIISH